MVETEFVAVSIIALVSFRCFDGFVPVVSFRCFGSSGFVSVLGF